ncbi:MAG: hypothetical protein J5I47_07480 [Vicingus serpentipes]|nr:hypothetical protein [Vicingus serpentipes]
MFTLFGKKKIQEDIVANIFVNTILNTVDNGFADVVGVINDAPEFIKSPRVSSADDDQFILIVFAANLLYLPTHLKNYQDERMTQLVISKLANAFNADEERLAKALKDYQCYLKKVNLPSKNTKYAMSKAIFGKYQLNQYQDEYFKNMNSPNPMFLKRLDEVMENFLWNWEAFLQKNQIVD